LVVRAGEVRTPEGRAALEDLCRTYWCPLYWFARRRGLSPQDAEDLTQGFLADLLARDAVAQADAARGRFRSFLLASFQNFHSHQQARAATLKRGGDREFVSLQALQEAESRFQEEPVAADSPEKVFDRTWAMGLIERAIAAVRHEYAAVGKEPLFDALKPGLGGGREAGNYVGIARQLGSTEGAVRMAAYRLRRRFGEALRDEVAKTVLNPADLEDEMRYLLAAVSL
jgi:RNA polymerase sigma-70 factor (ECF subfamily)